MNRLLDPEKKFFSAIGVVGDHLILSLLWMVCSLPVITIGAATTAMYDVSLKILEQKEYSLLKDFFHSFRRNFGRSTLLWLVFLAVGLILVLDLYFYYGLSAAGESWGGIMMGFFGALTLLYLVCLVWVFPCAARFRSTFSRGIVFSFLVGVKNLGYTVLMLAVAVALTAAALFANFLIPFVPGLAALVDSLMILRVFRKLTGGSGTGQAA